MFFVLFFQIELVNASFGWGDAPPTATGVNLKLEKVRWCPRPCVLCLERLCPHVMGLQYAEALLVRRLLRTIVKLFLWVCEQYTRPEAALFCAISICTLLLLKYPDGCGGILIVARMSRVLACVFCARVISLAPFWPMKGQKLAILGPNGAGKSTLLKAMGGVLPLSAGERREGEGLQPGMFTQVRFVLVIM